MVQVTLTTKPKNADGINAYIYGVVEKTLLLATGTRCFYKGWVASME